MSDCQRQAFINAIKKYKYSFVLGIPEAFITWGHQGRSLSNGTLVLNSWEADFFQV